MLKNVYWVSSLCLAAWTLPAVLTLVAARGGGGEGGGGFRGGGRGSALFRSAKASRPAPSDHDTRGRARDRHSAGNCSALGQRARVTGSSYWFERAEHCHGG